LFRCRSDWRETWRKKKPINSGRNTCSAPDWDSAW
jgi:hypothetical protein